MPQFFGATSTTDDILEGHDLSVSWSGGGTKGFVCPYDVERAVALWAKSVAWVGESF